MVVVREKERPAVHSRTWWAFIGMAVEADMSLRHESAKSNMECLRWQVWSNLDDLPNISRLVVEN